MSVTRQSRAVIRAPFAGVIVDLDVEQGEVAAPGAPIARLLQLDPIQVSVSVTDRDVAALEVGDKAQINTTTTADPVTGTIARIEPSADLQTRTFLVEVEVANEKRRLLPGMIAQVGFRSERSGEALFLPQDFIVTRLDGNGVFVVDGGKARWRPLELGGVSGTEVEVASGLEPGERIVTLGHRGLNDGDPLIISREGRCCVDGRVVFETGTKKEKPEPEAEAKAKTAKPDGAKKEVAQ
jgi:RND family efflux transporter MFP subunit